MGDLMVNYAEEERLLSHLRERLISKFILQNGSLITPLLLVYLKLGLVCTKIHRFVQYTPKKCFNRFLQAAVDARKKGYDNSNSSVVAETMKFLANSSYGYQILDKSRHTITKYITDKKKTHAANKSKNFKKLDHENNSLNSAKHRLNTKNQTLSGSSFFNTQNIECWSCTTTSPPDFVL